MKIIILIENLCKFDRIDFTFIDRTIKRGYYGTPANSTVHYFSKNDMLTNTHRKQLGSNMR